MMTSATLHLFTPHITWRDFQEVSRQLRQQWGVTKTKQLTEHDQRFLAVVERLEGEGNSPAGTKAFWEYVQTELKDNGLSDYKDWRGPRRKYDSLMKRLGHQL